MASWTCGIEGCGRRFDGPVGVIRHQTADHPSSECAVCGRVLPAGFLAIRHAFEEHTRAEYLRAYNADSDDIRVRERILDRVEESLDVPALVTRLEADVESAVSAGD